MAGVLETDALTVKVLYEDKSADIQVFYKDFFKAIMDKAFEEFGVEKLEQAKYALFDEKGERVPKIAKIYDNAEISDGSVLVLKPRA